MATSVLSKLSFSPCDSINIWVKNNCLQSLYILVQGVFKKFMENANYVNTMHDFQKCMHQNKLVLICLKMSDQDPVWGRMGGKTSAWKVPHHELEILLQLKQEKFKLMVRLGYKNGELVDALKQLMRDQIMSKVKPAMADYPHKFVRKTLWTCPNWRELTIAEATTHTTDISSGQLTQ